MATKTVPAAATEPKLRADAIGLPGAIMQGVASIAPAFAIFATLQFTVSVTGLVAPVAYLIAFLLVLMLAVTVAQLAKALPSAGGWYTWIAGSLHPRAGFLGGWMLSAWLPPTAALVWAFTAREVITPGLKSEYGVNIPWWIFVIVGLALVYATVYSGIALSERLVIITGLTEIVVMVALALTGLINPGEGGFNLQPFNPFEGTSLNSLYLGVVFSIFAFAGWECVGPIAEETRRPRRNVPLGLTLSVVVLGFYFLLTSWGFLVGLGTDNVDKIATASASPILALSISAWHGAWIIILFALINSSFAVSVAMVNAVTRLWFGMARSGALPAGMAKVSPDRKTPDNAIHVSAAISGICFLIAIVFGPADSFFTFGLVVTLSLIVMYIMANLGVIRLYMGERRAEFKPILHIVFPIASSLLVLWVGYKSVVPLPAAPVRYAPVIFAVYALLGIVVLIVLKARGNEAWLQKAGLAMTQFESGAADGEEANATRTAPQ